MLKLRHYLLLATPLALSLSAVASAEQPCGIKTFDASAAWAEAHKELAENYAYWNRFDAEAAFTAAGPAMRAAPDRLSFAQRLQTLMLLFRDSHLHVTPTPEPNAAWVPSAADFWLEARSGKLVVRDVKGGSEAAMLGVRPGWELLSMGGADPRQTALRNFQELGVSADAEQLLYAVNSLVAGVLKHPRSFEFRVAGKRRILTLPPGYDSVKRPEGLLSVARSIDSSGHGVAVLRVNNTLGKNELIADFDAAVATLSPDDHVIIDMRDTPSGGNSTVARAMISHFVEKPMAYQRHELTAERALFGVSRNWLEFVEPRAPFHRGKLIVLAGLWTGSMGEGIVVGFDAATQATVIGSQMGQLLGAMIDDQLPASCLSVSFANEKLWHVDGRPREDFLPETILPTADTNSDGGDPSMQAALALIARWDS